MDQVLNLPTVEDIRAAFLQGEEAVIASFLQQQEMFLSLLAQQNQVIEKQSERIQALEARLAQNSRTSSKPPSSDGYSKPKRTKSQRQQGQKPTGGQPGHEGSTLKQVEHPDEVLEYRPSVCQCCGHDLQGLVGEVLMERQVIDVPEWRPLTTAHRQMGITCPHCQTANRGTLPDPVKGPVQYGEGIKALGTLMTCGHHLPVARTGEILRDLLGIDISDAVILEAAHTVAEAVSPVTEAIRQALIQSPVIHVDESGLRVEGKLYWLHVASTDQLTGYLIHPKRGLEAMEAAHILTDFEGVAVHDHWKSYFHYGTCQHALCNAHHLRELDWMEQNWNQPWAGAVRRLLLKMKAAVEEAREAGQTGLDPAVLHTLQQEYDHLIGWGLVDNPAKPPDPAHPRRRPAQTPIRNLLERLHQRREEVLRFMTDFQVPFDNNQGERDIRMVKLKQKIAGGFRTLTGATDFATIRSYLSTARKNGTSFLKALSDALAGKPFYPEACSGI